MDITAGTDTCYAIGDHIGALMCPGSQTSASTSAKGSRLAFVQR